MNRQPVIVDCEVRVVHPSARRPDPATYGCEPAYEVIYSHPQIEEGIQYWAVEEIIASMDRLGVSYALLSGLAWNSSTILAENNEYVRECLLTYPDRFKGWYTPDLNHLDHAIEQVMQLDLTRYVGIELIPKWQNAHADEPRLEPLIETATNRDMFIKVYTAHPTQTLNGDAPYRTLQLLSRYPQTKFIIPHLGGLLCLYALHAPIQELLINTYFITSVSSTMKMVEFAARVNPNNLLFGTDFPFNHCFDQALPLEKITQLDIDSATMKDILGRTAEHLFGFSRETRHESARF